MAGSVTCICSACEKIGQAGDGHLLDNKCIRGRCTIVSDNSGHSYIIPVGYLNDWNAFCELDEDDERGWNVPDWAKRIDGGRVTFWNWRIE